MPLRTPPAVEHRPLVGVPRFIEISAEQRLGRVCIEPDCGATAGLGPAGHVYTETCAGSAPLGWAVVACPTHAPEESTR
ncbi:hypothetical protein [Kitasatospora sp. NBC_00315]|uniref:hypothetical protein n=1 Tax=Kitasatospora sp. NBC_00315 TaxID=2975963 RepID=UPI00324304C7